MKKSEEKDAVIDGLKGQIAKKETSLEAMRIRLSELEHELNSKSTKCTSMSCKQ